MLSTIPVHTTTNSSVNAIDSEAFTPLFEGFTVVPHWIAHQHMANHLKFVLTLHKKLKPLPVQSEVLTPVVDPLCGTPTVKANEALGTEIG